MKKKAASSTKAYLLRNPFHVLLLFAICMVPLALAHRNSANRSTQSRKATSLSPRQTLTFAERVAYQRAIEEVYWRHRIWPKERPDAKPSLDAVMSQAQMESKVKRYLRESQALEGYWQRPITAEQLQAELNRMVQNTKQPEVLKELFDALGNDPFVIAECLARPALAGRLLTNWYAYDQRIHGELRQRAEADLLAHPTVEQMKQTSGRYSEIELAKSDSAPDADDWDASHTVKLNSREWDETVQKLAVIFGTAKKNTTQTEVLSGAARLAGDAPTATAITQISTGVLSPLREAETHYYATAVLSKTDDRLKLATVAWDKEPLGSWLVKAETGVSYAVPVPTSSYTLPNIASGGCSDDTWTNTSVGPDGRIWYPAVWTGTEMIVWGGTNGGFDVATGWRYNPSTDTWTPTSMMNAPEAREFHTAVWTGSEMVVWGGRFFDPSFQYQYLNTGGRYNPATDTWIATSTANAPSARVGHTAVWTGSEMIIWGGLDQNSNPLNTGGRYNPGTDTWVPTSTTNAPTGRSNHTAVWTGSEMIVWGGFNNNIVVDLNTGGRYNPTTDSWVATSTTNVPSVRDSHTAVWTGSEMIVWGGWDVSGPTYLNTGGRYNLGTDSWTATSTINAPDIRYEHTAVWTGNEMMVWGGFNSSDGGLNTGGRYDPNTDGWVAINTTSAPLGRYDHTAVWTGSEMIVWGGENFPEGMLNAGGRYDPNTDSWIATASTPTQRSFHTAVWTGSEMIVWGGIFDFAFHPRIGSRYDPITDNWLATSITNAPEGRDSHTAIWTGSEMIIWGGFSASGTFLNNGGKYTPGSDSWTATSTANAPQGRYNHVAVWTGSEMIIWGGYVGSMSNTTPTNTGGRYNSDADTWIATTTTNAPSPRATRAGVWIGNEMVIWGGYDLNIVLNTGGRYSPKTDSWTATNTTNAPDARSGAAAVWTGNEMIVWGGYNLSTVLNTGGRYNPNVDSWTPTGTNNAPDARYSHTTVWSDSEMIIWGGRSSGGGALNTGGRYEPLTDTWTATSITNAPDARYNHTAVWSGSEMIVWGGTNNGGNTEFNTGGGYCAAAPSPTPTPTASQTPAPTPTVTPTATPTATAIATPSATATATPSATATATPSATTTATPRITPTPRARPTPAPRP